MTDITGDALRPDTFPLRREQVHTTTSSGSRGLRTGADIRAALAALPLSTVRRGYRPEAVEKLLERVADELDRRAQGKAPYILAEHVHPNGVGMTRPGYATGPARELLDAAAEALRL